LLLLLPKDRTTKLRQRIALLTSVQESAQSGNAIFKKWVRSFSSLLIRINFSISKTKRDAYSDKLMQAGLRDQWTPMEIFSLKVMLPFCILIFYLFLGFAAEEALFYYFSLVLSPISYFIPDYWLNTQVKKRKDIIRKELPHYVNAIAVMCEAGLNLFPAIKEVTLRKKGLLTLEFEQVLQQVTVGLPYSEALEKMAERCQVEELSRFVSVIVQAVERGASGITLLLRNQAKEIWEQRKKKAQQLGAEASMKLFFPLVLLAFPATVIFILGPVLLELFKFILS
jgi:tight adherence protein C